MYEENFRTSDGQRRKIPFFEARKKIPKKYGHKFKGGGGKALGRELFCGLPFPH